MNRRYLAAALGLVLLTTAVIMNASPDGLQWKTINEGLTAAPKENKLIVLDIYTDWCGWCKRMEHDTYTDSTILSYLKAHYLPCKMNPEKSGKLTYQGKEYTLAEFGQALGVKGYPTTVFFNEKGEVLTAVAGYMGPKDFLSVLKYFGDGVYLTGKSYEDYTKSGGAQ